MATGAVSTSRAEGRNGAAPAQVDELSFRQSDANAKERSVGSRLRDVVSVKDFGAVGNGATDDTAAFQSALNAAKTVHVPVGNYRISAKLRMGRHTNLVGEHEKFSVITGTHAGVMFEFPEDNTDPRLERLLIDGAGCTGVAVGTGNGPLQSYLIRPQLESVHFSHTMAFGINANCIFARLMKCSFGFEGAGQRAGTMVGIRSFSSKANYTNLNRLEACIFQVGTASPGSIAAQISGGAVWVFDGCDFEGCGRAVQLSNVQLAKFTNCWFEANSATDWVVDVGACLTPTQFENCNLTNNKAKACIQWNSRVGAGIVARYCAFGLSASSQPVRDQGAGVARSDTGGKLVWDGNHVYGGQPANRSIPEAAAGSPGGVNAWFVCDTRGAGTILASSHPGIAPVARGGVGDLSITLPWPTASAADRICVVATSGTATVNAATEGGPQRIRVKAYLLGTATPTDAVVSVMVMGL
ncbi:glycosyl hydrolase family 28-related protein [Methylibium sp.]|uniref:glycosyl hydrolase family 28-related protein n=1 Tax=Methylibium sp. TaxID=2067992 RepID=UPI003D120E72